MIAGDDETFMRQALVEARRAGDEGEVPIGAVVVFNGRVIGRGRNCCERLQYATAHAEVVAIGAASGAIGSWRLEGATLYVTVEPCPMCMGACLNARVERVVYATPQPKTGACGSIVDLRAPPGYNHRVNVESGVLVDDSRALMQEFFKRLRARGDDKPPEQAP